MLHEIFAVLENNDVETDLDEMWIMKKDEYDALTSTADSTIPQCTSPGEHFHEDEESTSEETDGNAAKKSQAQIDAKYTFSEEDIGVIIEEAGLLNDDDTDMSGETDGNAATKSQVQFDSNILLSEEDIGLLIQEARALNDDDEDKMRTRQVQSNELGHSPALPVHANKVNSCTTRAPRKLNEGMAHMMAHLHVMTHFVHL